MFEVTADQIALLSDEDLRSLVARLTESELRSRGISPDCVTWGGNQNAADGGVDVRVSLPPQIDPPGFIPRRDTGFQVKAEDTLPSKIITEMRPNGVLRPSIRQLAERCGAYIIVSSKGSTTDTSLQNRREAMLQAVKDLPDPSLLKLDFYDRTRVETWLRAHAGTTMWVRERIGKSLQGWSAYGAWSFQPEGVDSDYLVDGQLRLRARGQSGDLSAVNGINQIRGILASTRGVVRLVGLSGLGKTRLIEALFDTRVGEHSLDPALAVYTNLSNSPCPVPVALANELIAASKRAILIVDNCPPGLHENLSELCRSKGSELSLLTIEYDIREDQAEGTEVFVLEAASTGLIEKLVRRRQLDLSEIDARRIAEFSGGNARIAVVLAATVQKNDTLATLSDEGLFRRLFEQRYAPDQQLLRAAQAMSLVYSFEGEDVSDAAGAELVHLGVLVNQVPQEMFGHCAELERRGIIQRRANWRAILPPAIANRLAFTALQDIPPSALDACFLIPGRERLLRSFSRRLGQLSESVGAQLIAKRWLGPGGLLANVLDLDEMREAMFNNIAPVAPEETLRAIERVLLGAEDPEVATACKRYVRVLRLLAWDPKLFDRCVVLIAKIAKEANVDNHNDECRREFVSLFPLWFSGTHATIEQRLKITKALLMSADRKERTLGKAALEAILQASNFIGGWDSEFGTRRRDYGYRPQSTDDIKRWFGQALQSVEEIACSNSSATPEVREVVARQFRALWSSKVMFEDLERVFRKISETGFWPEGWIAIRQTIHYDSAEFRPEICAQLKSLESDLKPTDLIQKVRSMVLSDEVMFCGVDSTVDTGTDVGPTTDQAVKMAHDLGRITVVDEGAFTALLPDLLIGRAPQLRFFGRGLAEGTEKPRSIWDRLAAQLAATPSGSTGVLEGFISALNARQPDLANSLLDEAVGSDVLGPWYPVLQTAIGIDQAGLDRLMRSLDLRKASIWAYWWLQLGGVTHNLGGDDFNRLLLRIATEMSGVEIALDILRMRLLFEGRSNSSHEEIVYVGRELMRRIVFTDRRTDVDAHTLGIVARSCLLGDEGAMAVRAICQNLRQALLNDAYAFCHGEFLGVLLRAQPLATLDGLCGSSKADLKFGMQILREAGYLRPFDGIPDTQLIAWCDLEGETRYPAIAGGITSFESSHDAALLRWKPIARTLLDRAPDRVAVAKQLVRSCTPMFWNDAGSSLLDELAIYPDPALKEFIASESIQLRTAAEEQRRGQQMLNQEMSQWRGDERFE